MKLCQHISNTRPYLDLPRLLVESFEHALSLEAHAISLQGSESVRLPFIPAVLPFCHQLPDHLQIIQVLKQNYIFSKKERIHLMNYFHYYIIQ